jgi:hypothetical protein
MRRPILFSYSIMFNANREVGHAVGKPRVALEGGPQAKASLLGKLALGA